MVKRDGTVVVHVYDHLNRNTTVIVDGVVEQEFGYDLLSRMTRAVDHNSGRLTHMVDYEYDVFSRVTAESEDGRRVEKSYDPAGNLTGILYPSGKAVQRQYTATNLLDAVGDRSGGIGRYTYDADGRVTGLTLGNGISLALGYDAKGQEASRSYSSSRTEVFGEDTRYDSLGNVLRETVSRNNEEIIRQYRYDSLNRLASEQTPTFDDLWLYDRVGNWVFTNQNGFEENRSVNQDNEYTAIAGRTPDYDANGNLIADDNRGYGYDWKNRLVEVSEGGLSVAQYTYDARNRRITKTVGAVINYVYDNSQVIEEYEDNTLARSFVYGPVIDDPLLLETGGERYYYLKDRRHSVTALTDASGSVVERYEYSSFGLMSVYDSEGLGVSGSALGNPYGYTGRRWDAESGLWHYRNRAYSPILGRFMQRDPAGYVDGMNLYAYVMNNPLRFIDSNGLGKEKLTFAAALSAEGAFGPNGRLDVYQVHSPSGGEPRMASSHVQNNPIMFSDPSGLCASGPNWLEVTKGGVAVVGGLTALAFAPETMGASTAIFLALGSGSSIGWGVSQVGVGLTGNELPFNNTTDAVITAATEPGLVRDGLISAHEIIDLSRGAYAETAIEKAISITQSGLSIYDSINTLQRSH